MPRLLHGVAKNDEQKNPQSTQKVCEVSAVCGMTISVWWEGFENELIELIAWSGREEE